MNSLPVITGFGGVNAAGRSTFHLGYRRMIQEELTSTDRAELVEAMAAFANMSKSEEESDADFEQRVLENSLIRKIGAEHFDTDHAPGFKRANLKLDGSVEFSLKRKDIPAQIPEGWEVIGEDEKSMSFVTKDFHAMLPTTRKLAVSTAGTVPTGFDPAERYASRHHPRGLQLNTFAASDALQSVGIEWSDILQVVKPDQVSVYSGSAMAQLDDAGNGGLLRARWQGDRPSSKQCPLGLVEMPADFVNAYLLGSVGSTGAAVGACASFLYNLNLAIEDIKSGRARVALVGNAEAPVNPEVIEGYAAMSALATDDNLCKLDGSDVPNHRRASRPFAENCGFTIAEGAQYIVLMDDALALELGAEIYGATPGVFVNADGFKKSISAPGVGNYLTMAKAVGLAKAMLGEESVRERSMVQAHGSSTPANRVTESIIFDRVAEAFGIKNWPVTAMKSYLGHSLGVASGDQLIATLGVWEYGVIPRINNVSEIAEDVYQDNLDFLTSHRTVGAEGIDVAFLNAKGFGGNNATGVVISPTKTKALLEARRPELIETWKSKNAQVRECIAIFKEQVLSGKDETLYYFGEGVPGDDDISISESSLKISGFNLEVDLNVKNPY